MSKLLVTYESLKKQDAETIYLFKNGAFYLSLESDARFLSDKFGLKITSLNAEAVKCGFPCSSFDKYYILLNNLDKKFKIVDSNTISEPKVYLQNQEILDMMNNIQKVDINNMSVSEAFAFIERLKKSAEKILA